MAISLLDSITRQNPFKLDKYQGPFPDTTTALAAFPPAVIPLMVLINPLGLPVKG